jgi:hypothetical protein
MNKSKALKKDLKNKFTGSIQEVVSLEDPKPSKKVKKLITKSSKRLASAVAADARKARKKAVKDEKKAAKAEKKAAKSVDRKPKEKKLHVPAVVE